MKAIDTQKFSAGMRRRSVDLEQRRVLLADLRGSEQEADLTEPPNCGGLGRIRHFRRATSPGWPDNPLPIDPATHALGLATTEVLRAQAFQVASCNWRCWYCFVPFDRLNGDESVGRWLTAGEMVDLYLAEPNRPRVIDLTGGQPDLVPEWTVWTMEALVERGLEEECYLWSDDNLSNDYLWRFLSDEQTERLATFRNYGRVGCFKGFDELSFSFNTQADPALFHQQFGLFERMAGLGVDLYGYVTFTTPDARSAGNAIPRFLDRLQTIHENLPLRTVPLEIQVFTPVIGRLRAEHESALQNQQRAIDLWNREIQSRFSASAREARVWEVPFRRARRP